MLPGITEEVKRQAQERISSHARKILKGVDLMQTPQNHKKNSKEQETTWIPQRKHNCGTIVVRYLEDEQYQKRKHEQGYTQSDMEEFDRITNEERIYVVST